MDLSPLKKALETCETEDVLINMLDTELDINVHYKDGTTPITLALENHGISMAVIHKMLDRNVIVSTSDLDGNTPLSLALKHSGMDDATLMRIMTMACDIDINEPDSEGQTPIISAVMYNKDYNVVSLMVSTGADVNVNDLVGNSPLSLAISNNKRDAVPLSMHGSDSNSEDVIKILIDAGADVNEPNVYTMSTPLLQAIVCNCSLEIITLLVSAGAMVNTADSTGKTALRHSLNHSQASSVVQLLVRNGARISSELNVAIREVKGDNTDVVDKLLEASHIEINHVDEYFETPLMAAIDCFMSKAVIEKIIQQGADVNNQDGMGATPLQRALIANMNNETIDLILQAGVDVNKPGSGGMTPLIVALKNKTRRGAIESIIKHGADVNKPDTSGISPLHHAVFTSCPRGFSLVTDEPLNLSQARNIQLPSLGQVDFLLRNQAHVDKTLLSVAIGENSVSFFEKAFQFESALPYNVPLKHHNTHFLVSPLSKCFLMGQTELAKLFMRLNFIRKGDVTNSKEIMDSASFMSACKRFRDPDLTSLAKRFYQEPSSLWTISFVNISENFGFEPNRKDRVAGSGLPPSLKRKFMFQK